MSEPKRVRYPSHTQVPSTADLIVMVTRDKHLVVELPADDDQQRVQGVVDRISREAPEEYTVFESGGSRDSTWVTIKQVVSRTEVIEMEDYLVRAAQHFRWTATELALALAAHNHMAPERLWDECGNLEWHGVDWDLEVHGQHCCFVNQETGQTVEISLWFGTEFGVLDPCFFFDYMKTTPGLDPPAEFRDAFHDTRRALDILEERGKLLKVTGLVGSVGLTAFSETIKE